MFDRIMKYVNAFIPPYNREPLHISHRLSFVPFADKNKWIKKRNGNVKHTNYKINFGIISYVRITFAYRFK